MDVAASLRGPEIAGLCDRNRPMAWVEVRGTQSWKLSAYARGTGRGASLGRRKTSGRAKSLCSILALIYHYVSPALPVSKGAEGRPRCGSPNGRDGGAGPGTAQATANCSPLAPATITSPYSPPPGHRTAHT